MAEKCAFFLKIDLSRYSDDEIDYIGDQFPDRLAEMETAGKYIVSAKVDGRFLAIKMSIKPKPEMRKEIRELMDKIAAEKRADVEFERKRERGC